MLGSIPPMPHQAALNVLLDVGVYASDAQSLLDLAKTYGTIDMPHFRDSEDSHISLSVYYRDLDSVLGPGWNVKVSVIRNY